MYVASINTATFIIALFALWVRRDTWSYQWEQPKTLGLALITAGAILKAPPSSFISNDRYGLHLLIAHYLVLSGIAAFAYSANRKIQPDHVIRRWNITRIIVPGALTAAAMIALFALGARLEPRIQYPNLLTSAYWLIYDGMMIYFLATCAYALFWLFYDPPSRVGATMYSVACGLYLVAATCRALEVTVEDHVPSVTLVMVSATASDLGIVIFAIGAAYMWRQRKRSNDPAVNPLSQSVMNNTQNKRDKTRHSA